MCHPTFQEESCLPETYFLLEVILSIRSLFHSPDLRALLCLSPFVVHVFSSGRLHRIFIHWGAECETRVEQVDLSLNSVAFASEREGCGVQMKIRREYEMLYFLSPPTIVP